MADAVTAPPVRGERAGVLPVDEDELVACVACGLCLPHCPTYRVTGLERLSPAGGSPPCGRSSSTAPRSTTRSATRWRRCVQCRGCEAACPSTVPFGHLIEGANEALAAHPAPATDTRRTSRRLAEWFGFTLVLPRHRLLLAATWVLLVAAAPAPRAAPARPARAVRPLAADAARRRRPTRGRVPLPGLRDGRVAARRAPRRAHGDARHGRARRAARRRRRLLRRAPHPRRSHRAGPPPGATGRWRRCRATRRSSSTARAAARR